MRHLKQTKRYYALAIPCMLIAMVAVGCGLYGVIGSPPASWTLVIIIIASVIVCSPFHVRVGKFPGPPLVGVAVVMLAIHSTDEPALFRVGIWAIGRLIAELIIRRDLVHALLLTGLSSVGAYCFVVVQEGLADLGVWLWPSFAVATALYYLIFLGGEHVRQWAVNTGDRGFDFSDLSAFRVALVIVLVSTVASLMSFLESTIVPWLENDNVVSRAPLITLFTALVFYLVAQQKRYVSIERQMRALVDASIALPHERADSLSAALQSRARSIVHANQVELRDRPAERDEIGAEVQLGSGTDQYLIASRKNGWAPFAREDRRAIAAIAHMASQAASKQDEVDMLERRANTDTLTGLPNYGAFQLALVSANENRPYHEGIALLFMDLDNFKKLNDTWGHNAGDELLKAVAERLQGAAGGGDFVARVGGDEFVVILSGLVSLSLAKESADRIIEAVCRPLSLDGQSIVPMMSAGLAFSAHRELDAQTLVVDADRTMLQVKRSRRQGAATERNGVSISTHRSTRTNDIIARAIRENRLDLAFQPIVNIVDGKIWAFEALVRYIDPELGRISPPSLVARAKSLGLLNELTQQVIEKALVAAEAFAEFDSTIRCMTVNVELPQISETELGSFIRDAARTHPDITFCIELNERSLRAVTDELRQDAEAMQQAGLVIALDDYGSDDSLVGALVHFPMDILKIDKSLIGNLADVRQREVIKALQGYGDNLNGTVVVEGVETREMVDVLIGLGVRNAQGYFYGRPISFARTMDRLRQCGSAAEAG